MAAAMKLTLIVRSVLDPGTRYLVPGTRYWYLVFNAGIRGTYRVDCGYDIVSYEKSVRGVQGLFITFFFNAYIFTRIPVVRLNIPLPMIISYRYIYCSDPSQNHM